MAARRRTAAAAQELVARAGRGLLTQRANNGCLTAHYALSAQIPGARELQAYLLHETDPQALLRHTESGASVLHCMAAGSEFNDVLLASLGAYLASPQMASDLARQDSSGRTPLHAALLSGNCRMAQKLLQFPGAAAALALADKDGMRPLEIALLQALRHMDSHLHSDEAEEVARATAASGALADYRWATLPPLHLAIETWTALDVLLAAPPAREWASVYDPVRGVLPVHVVAAYGIAGDVAKAFWDLLTPEQLCAPVAGTSVTALHIAAANGKLAAVDALLRRLPPSFDYDAEDDVGNTPLAALLIAAGWGRALGDFDLFPSLLARTRRAVPVTVEQWRQVHTCDHHLLLELLARSPPGFLHQTTPEQWEGGSTPPPTFSRSGALWPAAVSRTCCWRCLTLCPRGLPQCVTATAGRPSSSRCPTRPSARRHATWAPSTCPRARSWSSAACGWPVYCSSTAAPPS
mmetsp:Transcript_764/g.2753  ORF Transcript_764/g.2753 Transcript_764/m.2753 type:complete len:465 (-) Transcript_764:284-1678(-)